MSKYNVELLPAAYSDLDEIFNYILADNPPAAERILEKVYIYRILHGARDYQHILKGLQQ